MTACSELVEDYKRPVQYKNRTTTMIRLTAPGG